MSSLRWLGAATLLLSLASSQGARAQTKKGAASEADELAACSEAFEQAQVLQRDGKLRAARERAIRCAQESCPSAQRAECSRWRVEVEAALPTIVLDARDERGEELFDVRVSVDGELVTERLDGRSLPLDPGEHVVRFERTGAKSAERRILVRQGEKNRRVAASLATARPAARAPAPPPADSQRPIPTSVFVLGGLGVVGLGSFVAFGIVSTAQESDAASQPCAAQRACPASDVDHIFVEQVVADVSLAVGVVALGVATVVYLTRPTVARTQVPATSFRF